MTESYRRLDSDRIAETARRLARRIAERFPESGLARVSRDLVLVVEKAGRDQDWIQRPIWPLRAVVILAVTALMAVGVATSVILIQLPAQASLTDMLQAIDAGVNDVVFLGIAIYFVSTLETRRKRRRALEALHALRSMAHIIDMHQLTKDPERVNRPDAIDTASSPIRELTVFELSRYLDYCSEMLSLLGKSAALYVQSFSDPVTLAAVNEVEDLTNGLSRKIWQKIMIIDRGEA
ncbi:MAG: hypothetical protein FJ206_01520 [Gemmatimonadetes bacterium]|nr:hypothetical protein [Gemmatimonadota bacterium]